MPRDDHWGTSTIYYCAVVLPQGHSSVPCPVPEKACASADLSLCPPFISYSQDTRDAAPSIRNTALFMNSGIVLLTSSPDQARLLRGLRIPPQRLSAARSRMNAVLADTSYCPPCPQDRLPIFCLCQVIVLNNGACEGHFPG